MALTNAKEIIDRKRAMPARYVLTYWNVRSFWMRVYGWHTDKVVRLEEMLNDTLQKQRR